MKLSISSIAWSAEEEEAMLPRLAAAGVRWVELAPARVFGKPEDCPPERVAGYRAGLASLGLGISSFQALLFGREDVHLFRTPEERQRLHDCLAALSRIAGGCGARAMVFGSPAHRRRDDMDAAAALASAVTFFKALAPAAAAWGTAFAIEPNPAGYQCDFLTHLADAAEFVRQVDRPGVTLNLDCGELIMNSTAPGPELERDAALAGHVHLSLPFLAPVTAPHDMHRAVLRLMQARDYDGFVTIEMKRPPGGPDEVLRAVATVQELMP